MFTMKFMHIMRYCCKMYWISYRIRLDWLSFMFIKCFTRMYDCRGFSQNQGSPGPGSPSSSTPPTPDPYNRYNLAPGQPPSYPPRPSFGGSQPLSNPQAPSQGYPPPPPQQQGYYGQDQVSLFFIV